MSGSVQLIAGASLSFLAAALHVAIVFGGPSWYRFFGAGEHMARLAEAGSARPTLVTLTIAVILFIWGLYALSGAGVVFRLPLLRTALAAITFIYLARGFAGLILPFISNHPAIAQNSVTFWLVSSIICCVYGLLYLLGTINSWEQLTLVGRS